MEWEEAQAEAAVILARNEGDLAAAFDELGIWRWEDAVIPVAETTMRALINPPASIGIEGTRQAFELFSARLAGLCAAFAMTAVLADRERVVKLLADTESVDRVDKGEWDRMLGEIRGQAEDPNA